MTKKESLIELRPHFYTPLALFKNKKLIKKLKKYIYAQNVKGIESKIAPQVKRNLKESKFDFLISQEKIIMELKQFIWESINTVLGKVQRDNCKYLINFRDSWFHIGATNSIHEVHTHSNCSWCGVYVIQAGDDDGGETVFVNPTAITGLTYWDYGSSWVEQQSHLRIKPEDGLMILFPSHILHHQALYRGKKDRIIIGFNLQILGKDSDGKGTEELLDMAIAPPKPPVTPAIDPNDLSNGVSIGTGYQVQGY